MLRLTLRPEGAKIDMTSKVGRKWFWVAGIAIFWLCIGLAVPLLISFRGEDIRFDNIGVVAAPRDTFHVAAPISIDPVSRAYVTAGRLALGSPQGQPVTAKASADLIASGRAMLVLDRGELVLGQAAPKALRDVPGGDDAAPLVTALKSGSFKALGVRDGKLILHLPGGQVERLSRANVQLVPDGDGAVTVKGEGFWRGQRSKFTLRSEVPGADKKVPIAFTLKASLLEASFEGHLESGDAPALMGKASLEIKGVERFVNALGRSWAIGPAVRELSIEGPFRWQAGMLAFDKAVVGIDGNAAQGTLGLKTTGEGQGVVTGTLAFDELDVASYLPQRPVSRDFGAWQWWRKLAASLSGESTPPVDADIRLSAAKLVSGDHVFGAAAATIAMKGGRLAADVAEINLLDGRATGQVSVDFNRFIPVMRLRGQLDGIRSGKWFKALTGVAMVDGVARIRADIVANGTDPTRIASDMRGRFDIDMAKGATIGVAVDELRTRVTSDEPEPMTRILERARAGTTQIEPFTAVAVISDGAAHFRSTIADYSKGKVQFAGRFDLVGREYDLRLLTTDGPGREVKAGGTRTGAKRLAATNVSASMDSLPEVEIVAARLLTVRRHKFDDTQKISLQPLSGSIEGLQVRLDTGEDTSGQTRF